MGTEKVDDQGQLFGKDTQDKRHRRLPSTALGGESCRTRKWKNNLALMWGAAGPGQDIPPSRGALCRALQLQSARARALNPIPAPAITAGVLISVLRQTTAGSDGQINKETNEQSQAGPQQQHTPV